ncbi:family 43 glycosylhydrolase [Coraliomargarita akajimensis]|uniref:Glycoside hydrolase family 43 n=1 Tax=Coraliomargarita akajimensis (strain DSM 45221 / IAM 15411 / JCM 23193 / KCTC 12865 / 04OKA010-24) TaxID=583355 RepID=D5ER07_CORAD|nr:family 43 glycosylhydrolase [Coraliomargarita akajimensis]ADE54000.1 glycoside hydrolase family 43 [Coraliomargarita akajimensis DSM 45221]
MKPLSCIILSALAASTLTADNPLVTHIYTADPTARVIDGKVFVFPSTDIPNQNDGTEFNGFTMPGYSIFSSTNLVQWDDYDRQISQSDVTWARQDKYVMWAPDCIEKDGTYYFYYPSQRASDNGFRIGLATASEPEGPYTLETSYISGANGIDPNVFIDDDGQAYLYWGGGNGTTSLRGAKLSSDMKSLDGATTSIVTYNLPAGYREGTFVFKHNGTYYFTFPLDEANDGIGGEKICYATGSSPLGPFTFQGTLIDEQAGCWTDHHSIIQYEGEWLIFYHYHQISGIAQQRSMRADYLTFNANGTIQKTTPTLRGIGTCPATADIQIDRYSEVSAGVQVERTNATSALPAEWNLGYIENGDWARYDRVDFGNGPITQATVRCSSDTSGGTVELRVGSSTGTLIASIPVTNTGGWANYEEFSAPVSSSPSGVQDLVAVFTGGGGYLLNIDSVTFSSGEFDLCDDFFDYGNYTVLGSTNGWSVSSTPSNDLFSIYGGALSFDLSQATRDYNLLSDQSFAMAPGRSATLQVDFRYRHTGGGNPSDADGSAFGMLVSTNQSASSGPNSTLVLANREGTLANRLPVAPWAELGPTHSDAGLDTTSGGYSDWLRLVWILKDDGTEITGTGYIYRVSDNTLLHTTTAFSTGFPSGSTIYPGLSSGWNNVGGAATVQSYTNYDQVQFDNYKVLTDTEASVLIFF